MTEDFIQKLMISKQIMDKHKHIPRNQSQGVENFNSNIELETFNVPQASYNLPEEFINVPSPVASKPVVVTEDKIKNSKLPDAIKKLMMEHPIQQPDSYSPTISNDVIEKAARLMGSNQDKKVLENKKVDYSQNTQIPNNLKSIIKETIKEILEENGLLIESENKSNDIFSFKVGKHIFEGRITKIKKVK